MALITAPPLKILTDLGYEIWELETVEDILDALKRTINELTRINEKDGRIPILLEALTAIRSKRKKESPSEGMKYTERTRSLKGSKFMGTAKPAATSRVNPVALLPAASEDQSVFSTLVSALTNIGSLLKRISSIIGIQFIFNKLLAARQRRKDALEEKRKREGELEGDEDGLKKRITNVLTKPIKSFWGTLLNFFKNIIFGSLVLSFVKWMKDPKNLETIQGISDWFNKHGKKVLIGVGTLLGLNLGFRLYRIFKRAGQLIRSIGQFVRPRALPRGGSSAVKASNKLRSKLASQASKRAALRFTTANATASRQFARAGSVKTAQEIASDIGIPRDKFLTQVTKADLVNPSRGDIPNRSGLDPELENIFNRTSTDPKELAKLEKAFDKPTRFPIDVPGQGRLSMTDDQFEVLKRLRLGTLSQDGADDIIKARKAIQKSTTVSGSQIMKTGKGVGPLAGIKSKFDDIVGGFLAPFKESLKKFTSRASVKAGGNILARGLPFVGAALDFASMVEEAKRGNIAAATFFGFGSLSSALSGAAMSSVAFAPFAGPLAAFSFAMSILGIGASIIEDNMRNRTGAPRQMGRSASKNRMKNVDKILEEGNVLPAMMSDISVKTKSYVPPNQKRKKNIRVIPIPIEQKQSTSGSGHLNNKVPRISSVDEGNPNWFVNKNLYNIVEEVV